MKFGFALRSVFATMAALSACTSEQALVTEPDAAPSPIDAAAEDSSPVVPEPDASVAEDAATQALPDPVIFVHGIKGSSADFAVMIDRLVADGWPPERLFALDYPDPEWGCNIHNANTLRDFVAEVRETTGAARVDLVAHSMGTLSSRHFLKFLGGTEFVNTFVTLGGMHGGVPSACLNPLPVCIWEELCASKPFLTALNEAPKTPAPSHWVSLYSNADDTVSASSAHLDGAENIAFDDVDHAGANGLLEHAEVYAELLRVLVYPAPTP